MALGYMRGQASLGLSLCTKLKYNRDYGRVASKIGADIQYSGTCSFLDLFVFQATPVSKEPYGTSLVH